MLPLQDLRQLTLDGHSHPRGQAWLSAASGLVCAHDRVYVVADDEHHLAVYRNRVAPGTLHRLVDGDLPGKTKARKKAKADFESLFLLTPRHVGTRQLSSGRGPAGPAQDWAGQPASLLVALGSGSRPQRCAGVVLALDSQGEFMATPPRLFDLGPLFRPLRAALGDVNIEGAMVVGDALLLLNRAVDGRSANALVRFDLADLFDAMDGLDREPRPRAIRDYALGSLDGVALGFTDGAALPDGGWVFTAAAERRDDSVADGECAGSVVGRVDAAGTLQGLHRLAQPLKAEGIAVRAQGGSLRICLVTDADDPLQPSRLLVTQL